MPSFLDPQLWHRWVSLGLILRQEFILY
jgi:hypothetical protein